MSTFKALNIESDDESADEIDNTKEIQIEEALKLYQTALKLHSSEHTLKDAGEAYQELFQSAIFNFPESQSEYNRVAAYQDLLDQDAIEEFQIEDEPVSLPVATENAPSTLPQILHLSYKNRGEHHLDLVRREHDEENRYQPEGSGVAATAPGQADEHIRGALQDFAEALDKDEDDADLWRRSARVSQALNSARTSRYCLESALEEDVDNTDSILSLPSFEAMHDHLELRKVQTSLRDDLSTATQDPITEMALPPVVQKALDLYPSLSQAQGGIHQGSGHQTVLPAGIILTPEDATLDAIGKVILQQLLTEKDGTSISTCGQAVHIQLPTAQPTSADASKSTQHGKDSNIAASNAGPTSAPTNMTDSEQSVNPGPGSPVAQRREDTASPAIHKAELPLRKRSTSAAELPETPEGERGKSKRLRARKSTIADRNATDGIGADLTLAQDPKHDPSLQADRWLFDLMRDILRKMDVKMICNADQLRKVVSPNSPYGVGEGPNSVPLGQAMQDLYGAMQSWNFKKTDAFLQPDMDADHVLDTSNAGLLAFLDSSIAHTTTMESRPIDVRVEAFVRDINSDWKSLDQVAIRWVIHCMRPFGDERADSDYYLDHTWTTGMKTTMIEILLAIDRQLIGALTAKTRNPRQAASPHQQPASLVQTIFELHLEHLVQISGPSSNVSAATKALQRTRLTWWCDFAREHLVADVQREYKKLSLEDRDGAASEETIYNRSIFLRHLWATVFSLKALDAISREHLILCIDDLKMRALKQGKIRLPNNRVMPELSVEAADKERSKCETMDFFLSIFDVQEQHPVDLIEKLEPILTPNLAKPARPQKARKHTDDAQDHQSDSTESTIAIDARDTRHEILSEFLSRAKPALRLSLWFRLRDAYREVEFYEKILAIDLRILRVIVAELQGPAFTKTAAHEREALLLSWLSDLHELLLRCFNTIESQQATLECLPLDQLKEVGSSLVALFTLLHTVALFDDFASSVQKGPPLTNPFKTYPSESFHTASIRLHDMKLRTVILLYRVIQEASQQMPTRFPFPDIDRYEYLQYMHYELGMRRICKASDNLFLKFMQTELLSLKSQPITNDLAQILYDLYDLHCFSVAAEKQEHGCEPNYLDRSTALTLVDFVLERTQGTSLKDLPKVDLGKSVEKLQAALGTVKSTPATNRNRKIISAYLKSAINPMDLFQSLKGIPLLPTSSVPTETVPVASKGWYYLMAQINLAKYRRAKGGPVELDDLEMAVTFLTHDLECDSEKWESWHRLAYAQDSLIEESVLWSAEKINTGRSDLAQMQRSSLHSYVQAAATAMRNAEVNEETTAKLGDLYADFGNRMYASCRPPFSMNAFSLREFPERYYSGPAVGGGTYTRKAFKGLRTLQALRLAATLMSKGIKSSPNNWQHHYTLGKCLWKMHVYATEHHNLSHLELAYRALSAFDRAIETVPPRKDPARQEPTLEPITKVVFTIHKMVTRHELIPADAADRITEMLSQQKQFDVTELPALEDPASWDDYMLSILRVLRTADRAKWHHRLHYKMAEVIYAKHGQSDSAAKITRDFMVEERLYSVKTLAVTVWKPVNERPGRHWVYMTTYTRFVSRILEQAEDVEAIQLLARRVRKKPAEFYEHTLLWEEVSEAHLRLHRKLHDIPVHNDDVAFKNLTTDDFKPRAEAVDAWLQKTETMHPLLDVLREATELKKVNAGLAKSILFDDLIADTYAQIYKEVGPTLPLLTPAPTPASNTNGTSNAQQTSTNATATPEPHNSSTIIRSPERSNVMAMNNLINNDGAADAPPSPWRTKPVHINQYGVPSDPMPKPRAPRAPRVTRLHIIKRAVTAVHVNGSSNGTKAGAETTTVRVVIDNRRKGGDAAAAATVGGARVESGEADAQEVQEGMQGDSNDASSELSDVNEGVGGDEELDGGLISSSVQMLGESREGDEEEEDEHEQTMDATGPHDKPQLGYALDVDD